MTDWAPFDRPMAINIPITTEEIRLDFPVGRFLVNEPVVLVTINDSPTEVSWTSPKEPVAGYGEVHTHIALVFATAAVGKRVSVWVCGT